jgi:hypothetical protein
MPTRGFRACLGLAAAGAGLAVLACADDRTSSSDSAQDRVERLEALLEAQQRKIDDLQRQVSASSMHDMDAQRVEEMKRQIRSVLSEQEFRESLMPSVLQAGYDNGFYIRSSDDKFLMKFTGLVQFRFTHYGTRSDNRYLLRGFERDDRTGFDVQRVRFRVDGNAYSPDLTYHIEFKADSPQQSDFVLDTAWINYRICDEFQIKLGQFGLASTRSQTYGGNSQMVDEGIFDAVYGLGASTGVRFWGHLFNKRLDYFLDVVNGTSDNGNTNVGRTITNDPAELDGNPAILAKVVWHVLAEDPGKDFTCPSDFEIHQTPVWDVGFHYVFNDDQYDRFSTRIPVARRLLFARDGGFGLVRTNGLQFHDFGFDTAFKWCGFSATAEYVCRIVDVRRGRGPDFAPWFLASGDGSTTAQHGAYVQAGYFLPLPGALANKIEAVARFGGISALADGSEGTWEYAGGVNYYIDGDRVKLQADVTKISEVPTTSSYSSLANVNDDALIFRVQLSLAF